MAYIDVICKIEKKISEIEERLDKLQGIDRREITYIVFKEDYTYFYHYQDKVKGISPIVIEKFQEDLNNMTMAKCISIHVESKSESAFGLYVVICNLLNRGYTIIKPSPDGIQLEKMS